MASSAAAVTLLVLYTLQQDWRDPDDWGHKETHKESGDFLQGKGKSLTLLRPLQLPSPWECSGELHRVGESVSLLDTVPVKTNTESSSSF